MNMQIDLISFLLLSTTMTSLGQNILLNCDFDESFCAFGSDPDVELTWTRRSGSTLTPDTGPESDHTTGSGSYVYMEVTTSLSGDRARFFSPPVVGSGGICSTIIFYYHMYGRDIGSLNVYLEQDPPLYDNPVWEKTGEQGRNWIKAEINVSLPLDYKIAFEGIATGGIFNYEGDIAIDDVTIVAGECDYVACDESVIWCQNGGTCIDVSSNSTADDIYVCQCAPGWEGTHCDLDVDECADNPCQNGGTCTHGVNSYQCFCDLGYHGTNCEYEDFCISPELHRCDNGGTCAPDGNNFTCACVPGYTGRFCEIDIDECATTPCVHGSCTDLVNNYKCDCFEEWVGYNCDLHLGGCTFDHGFEACGYKTAPVIDYSWELGTGSTPSFGTGPDEDHTTGNGNYMYADESVQSVDDRALLYSPMVTSLSVGSCTNIRFWYHMDGLTIGTLNLYISGTGNNELETNPVWTKEGEQGTEWLQGSVSISSAVPFSLVFESVAALSLTPGGDIAIDDVTLDPNACAFLKCSSLPCQNGGTCFEDETLGFVCSCTELWTGQTCTEDSNLCLTNPCQNGATCVDLNKDYRCDCATGFVGGNCQYELGSCDFDNPHNELCYYEDDVTGDFTWYRLSGRTPSAQTGPDFDHTTGNGFYLYAEATDRVAGEIARIKTPTVLQSGSQCTHISFWFYMFGASVGELAVHLYFDGQPLGSPIWTKIGNDRGGWTYVQLNVSAPQDFHVVFEAVMDDKSLIDEDNRGDIAIDDVIMKTDTGCSYDTCFVRPCQNGGTCVADDETSFTCLCPGDFGGKTCEQFLPCQPNPCQNGGICGIGAEGNFECLCKVGFLGNTCERIDYCLSHACENGGTCVSGPSSYTCSCVEGYTGEYCGSEIDECLSNPCLNGGTCTDGINSYSCQCRTGSLGDQCEKVYASCNFELQSFCGWTIDAESDFNWIIESGPGSSWPFSGPQFDHTYQSVVSDGYYIYTPLSRGDPPSGSVYRIRSPIIELSNYPNNEFEIELFYHMYGTSIGTFNIYIEEMGSTEYSILKLEKQQGNDWLAYSDVITVQNDWWIILEHAPQASITQFGDLAIDDVKIMVVQKNVQTTPSTTRKTTQSTTTQTTTTTEATTKVEATTKTEPTTTRSSTTRPGEVITTTVDQVTKTSNAKSTTIPQKPGTDSNIGKDDNDNNDDGLDGGAIAGIVVGVLGGIALLFGGVYFFMLRPARRQSEERKRLKNMHDNGIGIDNPAMTL